MSRPVLSDEAEVLWRSFLDLDRDRRKNKVGGGMAGTVDIPECIDLDRIRAEGIRQEYEGDALEDFVAVIRGVDDEFVRLNAQKILSEFRASIARLQSKR